MPMEILVLWGRKSELEFEGENMTATTVPPKAVSVVKSGDICGA